MNIALKRPQIKTNGFLQKLRFKKDQEQLFNEDYSNKVLVTVRIAIILAILLYSVFGFLDVIVAPSSLYSILFIRFAIVVPVFFVMLALTFLKKFKIVMQPVLGFGALIGGFGIIAMLVIVKELESFIFYYTGLILVIMWTYTFVRLKFIYASAVCWTILIAYELTAIFIRDTFSTPEMIRTFVNNNFFFISANIMGMFAGYLIELFFRKDFLQRIRIENDQKIIGEERDKLSHRNKIMENELDMARYIQRQFLTPENIQKNNNIATLYKPVEAIGGDLYSIVNFRDSNKIGIFIGDVSGHGVPAALITCMIRSILLDSGSINSNPAKLFLHLNELLVHQTGENFITAFYGIIDPDDHSMVFTNAGHYPPYLVYGNKVKKLDMMNFKKIPLAIVDNSELMRMNETYSNLRVKLPENSKLVLFTDGLLEARNNGSGQMTFDSEIDEILVKLSKLSPSDLISNLYQELGVFNGSEHFDDDISIICIDIK